MGLYQMNVVLFEGSDKLYKMDQSLKYKKFHLLNDPSRKRDQIVWKIDGYAACRLQDPGDIFICGGLYYDKIFG